MVSLAIPMGCGVNRCRRGNEAEKVRHRSAASLPTARCFSERDPAVPLWRRALAETVGTLLLTLAVAGSALVGAHATLEPLGGLLANAFAIGGALAGLIVALGPVSGGHFNPLITLLQWWADRRSTRCALAYCAGQLVGAAAGAAVANGLVSAAAPRLALGGAVRWHWLPSEFTCAFGLLVVVFGCIRSDNRTTAPFGVGAWLTACIIATPSRSLANPAVAVAMILICATGSGSVSGALLIAVAEVCGALFALALIGLLYPQRPQNALAKVRQAVGESS